MMAFCAAVVLSVGACRDGDEAGDGAAEDAVEETPADTETGAGEPGDGQPEEAEEPTTTVEGEGLAYDLPEDWEPIEESPEDFAMDSEALQHGLVRDDGTVLAYTSATLAEKSPDDGPAADAMGAANLLSGFIGPLNEGFEARGVTEFEVPGAPDAARADMGYNTDLSGTTLVVDTGTDDFTMLHVVLHEAAQPDGGEAGTDDLEAILTSVRVD